MSIVEEEINEIVPENQIERESVDRELKKIDEVREIVEEKYPSYGIIRDFINHLASTEKVFLLAGIKKFGGDEIMDMFIDSETGEMAGETGIDEDVFDQIKEEFFRVHKTVDTIEDISERLSEKYPESKEFLEYMEEHLMMLLRVSANVESIDLNLDKETTIQETIKKIAENDELEIQKLEEVYQEFKEELEKVKK